MQGIGKIPNREFSVIANNMEKYISFSIKRKWNNLRISLIFIDSFQFMNASLEKLVSNLPEEKFRILKENIHHQDIKLLLRKGVYPYEYINSFDKFKETQLPFIENFQSTLTGESISSDDYIHAQTVWQAFHIQNLGEYHDLYVKSDVLQLADVFENFRQLCKTYYSLDCAHFMTAPGLAWQACLKMTDQALELLTDVDMHLFIENGIRGGVSMITQRKSVANNKYLKNFDSTKESKYILYLDANNLYGWAMSQPLPYGNFEWVEPDKNIIEKILTLSEDSLDGYILEVDLEYPKELHNAHNDYPLAPEKMKIIANHLSPYAVSVLKNDKFISNTKLVPNLNPKFNYIIYHKNLQLYLSLGMKLTHVHKIIKFKQKAWLQPYIQFNTDQRKDAQTGYEKDFFKLMNNSVYGKTMENVRKHIDVQLVNTEKRAKKLVAAPTFHNFRIFDHDLVGIQRLQNCVSLNRPIYVGFVILELSKYHMYNFHYNHIKKQYGQRAKLLFTDTDSLTYEILTEDVYRDMSFHMHLCDMSDYPKTHALYNISNKKKIVCFKDEMSSKAILEFIGLRAKMYSLLLDEILNINVNTQIVRLLKLVQCAAGSISTEVILKKA
ncbi:hypothetical protein X975_19802, partial [Stegodyphus mimosarum]